MIKLFSEKVDTFTSSDLNILQVENFEEIFFDVYEFEINGNKHIAEKVGVYSDSSPIVNVPVVEGRNKLEASFILRKGPLKVYYNYNNGVFIESVANDHNVTDTEVYNISESLEEVEEEITVSPEIKDELINEIKQVHKEETRKLRIEKELEIEKVRQDTEKIKEEINIVKEDLVDKFIASSLETKEYIFEVNDERAVVIANDLQEFVNEKVKDLRYTLVKDKSTLGKHLDREVEKVSNKLTKALKTQDLRLNEHIVSRVEREFNSLTEVVDKVFDKRSEEIFNSLQKQSADILNLERANVELRDDIVKSSNKALSRIGNVKKDIIADTRKEARAAIAIAESNIKEYYDKRIKIIVEAAITETSKDKILSVIEESKDVSLKRVDEANERLLKEEVFDLKKFKKEFESKFTNEMQSLKRLMEMTSGGGSVAVQYADGGTMNGDLDIIGNILSGGVNLDEIFGAGGGQGSIGGSGTPGTITIWDGLTSIGDSILREDSNTIILSGDFIPGNDITYDIGSSSVYWKDIYLSGDVYGELTFQDNISGQDAFFNEITALTANFTQTIVSTTSSLSVINTGTGPALYVQQEGNQPIIHIVDKDGDDAVFADNGDLGLGTFTPNEKLTVVGNISATGTIVGETLSASGRVDSSNIETLENKVTGVYSYLINNFDSNQITTATDLNDFVTNYPKEGLAPGDVITLSAINIAYLLGDRDGSSTNDWFEINLKPNFIFYKQGLDDYSILDSFPLSGAKSSKYIMQVEDLSDNALFYGEVNVVSDGTIAVATEYGLNHTTVFPFVEFGAVVQNGTHLTLSAISLEGKTMTDFRFKGNRTNLFG